MPKPSNPKTGREWEQRFEKEIMCDCDGSPASHCTSNAEVVKSFIATEITKAKAEAVEGEREGIAKWFENGLSGEYTGVEIAKLIRSLTK